MAALLGVCGACAIAGLAACDNGEPPVEKIPEITETVRYSEKTNPYAELTWQEYADVDDWDAKMTEAKVYYQFEGSYSEAYQGDYSRTFLYMNCYEDGSRHATYGNDRYYGFWTNVDNRGRENLVLHIVRFNNGEYNNGLYESVVDSYSHDFYEYQSTIIWNQWGARTVNIFGSHYSPVKSITLGTPDSATHYTLGDNFTTEGLTVTVTHENGKSIDIDEQSFAQNDCRVKFTGVRTVEPEEEGDPTEETFAYNSRYTFEKEGDEEVTVTYINTEVSAKYKVSVYGINGITVNADEAVKEFYVGDRHDATGLVITADRKDGQKATIAASRCTFEGFDSSKAAQSQEITVKFLDFEDTYSVKIVAPTYTGQGKYNGTTGEVKITVITDKTCDVEFGGKTAHCEYTTMSMGSGVIYSLVKPAEGSLGVSDEEWNSLHKQYTVNRADLSLGMIMVYEIPDNGYNDPNCSRFAYEPFHTPIGGYCEQRFLYIDEASGTLTFTYKYFNGGSTDTWVLKFTITEQEDGTKLLTFTEVVSSEIGWSGKNGAFENGDMIKEWILHDDFTATPNGVDTSNIDK